MDHADQAILPGLKPVMEILAQNPQRISRIYLHARMQPRETARFMQICQKNGIPCTKTTSRMLAELCEKSGIAHQGIVAILNRAGWVSLPEMLADITAAPLPLILALDQIQDPRNIGAIARTAWALGCAGLLLPRHNCASLGAAAFKTSAGTLGKLPVCSVGNLAKALDLADESGLHIYGAGCRPNVENAFSMAWNLPAILVLGNEEKGIRPGVLKRCHTIVNIPFARKFDSLNVAQAGALLVGLCAARHMRGS